MSDPSKLKNKEQKLKQAVASGSLDETLKKVEKIDNICCYIRCKTRTNLVGIDCRFCKERFCTSHALPEVHGCDIAIKKEEREVFKLPIPKVTPEQHGKNQTKLNMKLKQMQQERKPKQGNSKSKK